MVQIIGLGLSERALVGRGEVWRGLGMTPLPPSGGHYRWGWGQRGVPVFWAAILRFLRGPLGRLPPHRPPALLWGAPPLNPPRKDPDDPYEVYKCY